jgi:hypothetical protein
MPDAIAARAAAEVRRARAAVQAARTRTRLLEARLKQARYSNADGPQVRAIFAELQVSERAAEIAARELVGWKRTAKMVGAG